MKCTQNGKFVVFLDVDGVLNTRSTCERAPSGKYIGVDGARIELLSQAMKQAVADGVILTTTWKDLDEQHEDYIYLVKSLEKYEIKILGKTKEERVTRRGEGIITYLKEHPEIEEFVILDDQHFEFKEYRKLWESFIDTQAKGLENSIWAAKTPTISAILFLDAIKKYA